MILLWQPLSESYPDVSVKLVKHSTGIDCPLVTGPSSHQRVDRFQLVQVIIIECLFVGHVLHLLLDPLQALFCRLPKDPDDGAVSGSITAEDVLAQAIEAVNDVSDDGFLFAELKPQGFLKKAFAFFLDVLCLCSCSAYGDDPVIGVPKHRRCGFVLSFPSRALPSRSFSCIRSYIGHAVVLVVPLVKPMHIDVGEKW